MRNIALSICIPTYNFGEFIGETIESILPQLMEDMEVLVVDGASTDNTADIVQRYQRMCPSLRYIRLEKRGGIDLDMAKAVELSRGDYCWLFSADDIMAKGAVEKVLNNIRKGADVYILGFTRCTLNLVPISPHPILEHIEDADYELNDPGDRRRLFSLAQTTAAFCSFMSSLVVNRKRWEAKGIDEDFVGSCWAHVARLLHMIPEGLKVRYLAGEYLLNRGGNDSFLEKGLVHRIGIAIDGFHRIAEIFFGRESIEAYHIRRVLKNEYSLRYLLYAKLVATEKGGTNDRTRLDTLVEKLFIDRRPSDNVRLALYRLAPVPALRVAAAFSRRFRAARPAE